MMTNCRAGILGTALALLAGMPARADAQPARWLADVTAGDTVFVDEDADHFFTLGGSARMQVSPRISIGPEFVVMRGDAGVHDLSLMLTGKVVLDVYPMRDRDMTPFLVGGLGVYWARGQFVTGSFWSSDPAFTAGGGFRGRLSERVWLAAEYRIGWELHQSSPAAFRSC